MDHRTSFATFRTLARRTGTAAGHAALTVARLATRRIAEHRSSRSTPPGGRAPDVPAAPPADAAPEPVAPRRRAGASPADVARAVGRNAAGLARTNASRQPRQAVSRSGPGAKLPARAGQGIVGV